MMTRTDAHLRAGYSTDKDLVIGSTHVAKKCSSEFIRSRKDLSSSYVPLKGDNADFAASRASCITSLDQDPICDGLKASSRRSSGLSISTGRRPDACRV